MMQGLLDYLLSPAGEYLRQNCVFKIVPMLNPDGVICGNYRTGMAGRDLNRQFKNTDKVLYPCVYYMK
jgi:murein tripeptide amidase MpaA